MWFSQLNFGGKFDQGLDALVLISTREKNENVFKKWSLLLRLRPSLNCSKFLFVLHKKDLSDGHRLKVFKFPKFFTFNTCHKP